MLNVFRDIYESAGLNPDTPPSEGALALAVALYGASCLVVSPSAPVEVAPARVRGQTKIVLARMSPRRTHFAVARGVAQIELAKRGRQDVDANQLAALLVAPPVAFSRELAATGLDLPTLATSFVITETCAAIRAVEVGATDGIVVTPARVYRPSRSVWCDDHAARALAKGRPRSLRKVPIRDEPGRVALYRAAG